MATLALARFGPELWGAGRPAATWAAVVVNLVAGVGWIVAFTRFLPRSTSCSARSCWTRSQSPSAAGWVAGFGYIVAERAGLVADVDVAVLLPVFVAVVFLIAFAAGKIRYR